MTLLLVKVEITFRCSLFSHIGVDVKLKILVWFVADGAGVLWIIMMPQYVDIYYFFAIALILSLPILYHESRNELLSIYKAYISFLIILIYIYGMLRTDGVDIENYLESYENSDSISIFDKGYMLLSRLFGFFGFPFTSVLFFSGCISIFAVHRLSKFYNLSFVLLISIFFLHTFIVRDFSQFRVGLAIAIAFIALTTGSRLKWLLYVVAVSMHITAIVFIIAYEASLWAVNLKRQSNRILFLGACFFVILAVGLNMSYLSFLDPRIDLYLNWKREGYGLPVNSYKTVLFHTSILLICFFSRKHWTPRMRGLVYLQCFGLAVFFAFSNISVFAHRLSNVTLSLYPVLLLLTLDSFRAYIPFGKIAMGILLIAFSVALIFRSESMSVLSKIVH